MKAAEASTAPAKPNREIAVQVMDHLNAKKGADTVGADRRTLRNRGRGRAAVLPSAIATSASLSLLNTCSGVCLFLAVFPLFHGPILYI